MPRPREFEVTDVLDRATRLFWQRGYGGTSLNDLEKAMGIGRTSIYAAFGGKESLFLQVVDHYDSTYGARLRSALRAGGSVKAAIARYFEELLNAFNDPDLPLGSLITNVAVEGDRGATRLGRKIAHSISRTEDLFYEVLREGQTRGEVDPDVDIRALARYFVAVTHGLSTLAKGLPTASALTDVTGLILAGMDNLLKPSLALKQARTFAIPQPAPVPVTAPAPPIRSRSAATRAQPARFTLANFWSILAAPRP